MSSSSTFAQAFGGSSPGGGSAGSFATAFGGGGAVGRRPSAASSGGSYNSRLWPDFLSHAVDAVVPDAAGHVAGAALHGGADFAVGTLQGLYGVGHAAVRDVINHPASIMGGPAAPLVASAISAAEGGGGGHLAHDVAIPVAHGYWAKYAPIIQHPLTGSSYRVALADPIGTTLDLLSVAAIPFTAGGSAAARGLALARVPGAARLAELGEAMQAGRTLSYTDEAGRVHEVANVGRTSSPVRRLGQKGYDAASERIPSSVAGRSVPVSMEGRVTRLEQAQLARADRAAKIAVQPYRRALTGLTEAEKLAVPLLAQGIDRPSFLKMVGENHASIVTALEKQREAHIATIAEQHGIDIADAGELVPPVEWQPATATTRLLHALEKHGPKIDQALATATGNPRMMRAVDEARTVASRMQTIYQEAEKLTPETAQLRRERPSRVAAGSRKLSKEDLQSEEVQALQKELREARAAEQKAAQEGDGDLMDAANHKWEQALEHADELGLEVTDEGRLTGWTTHDEAVAEANRAGIDPNYQGEPIYMPHTGPRTGAGERNVIDLLEPQRIPAEMRTSAMVRFQMGDLLWNPDLLSQAYLRSAQWDHARQVRDWASGYAVALEPSRQYGGKLPGVRDGYSLMRRRVEPSGPIPAAIAGRIEKGGTVPRSVLEHQAMHDEIANIEGDILNTASHREAINQLIGDTFPTTIEGRDVAKMMEQGYVQVPDRVARMAKNELQQSTAALTRFYDKALDVWRTFVLYTRPAWLVNNIFGQHLLYFIHHAGPAGLRAYLRTAEVHVERGKGGRPRLVSKYGQVVADTKGLESLVAGGPNRALGGSGRASLLPRGVDRPAVKAAKTVALPIRSLTQSLRWANYRLADDQTRIAAFLADPELAALHAHLNEWTGIMGETKRLMSKYLLIPNRVLGERVSLEEAIGRIPQHDAERMVERVSKQLGDYREMSPVERRYLVRIFPFWGWYRTIGVISLRLPIEHPIRTNFIYNLEQAAKESGNGVPKFAVPSWLRGAIDVGPGPDGTETVLSTAGLNPFQTDVQVATALGSTVAGKPQFGSQGPLSLLTPAAAIGFQTFGIDPFYGGQYRGPLSGEGAPGRALAGVYTSLPQYRLGEQTGVIHSGYKSTLYNNTRVEYLLNYLGLPIKNVYPREAERRAAEGQ